MRDWRLETDHIFQSGVPDRISIGVASNCPSTQPRPMDPTYLLITVNSAGTLLTSVGNNGAYPANLGPRMQFDPSPALATRDPVVNMAHEIGYTLHIEYGTEANFLDTLSASTMNTNDRMPGAVSTHSGQEIRTCLTSSAKTYKIMPRFLRSTVRTKQIKHVSTRLRRKILDGLELCRFYLLVHRTHTKGVISIGAQ